MVTRLWRRRGTGTLGCLLWVVLFGVALHYGLAVGRVYHRYLKFEDAMRTAALSAPFQGDDAIRRTLVATAEQLKLPAEARRVWIRRTGPPFLIEIQAWYDERLSLPLGKAVDLTFHPTVEYRF